MLEAIPPSKTKPLKKVFPMVISYKNKNKQIKGGGMKIDKKAFI